MVVGKGIFAKKIKKIKKMLDEKEIFMYILTHSSV